MHLHLPDCNYFIFLYQIHDISKPNEERKEGRKEGGMEGGRGEGGREGGKGGGRGRGGAGRGVGGREGKRSAAPPACYLCLYARARVHVLVLVACMHMCCVCLELPFLSS